MVKPMVHSTKHYVQKSIATIVAGAIETMTLVHAVTVGTKDSASEVEEGNSVKACYIEMWLRSSEAAPGSFIAALYKQPGTGVAFTGAQMAAMNTAENKKNVLWFGQGLVNDQNADALAMLRGWYKIPKSKQRMGLGDQLVLSIFAQGAIDIVRCGFATYKEYS